jgi:hypothetical protein
MTTGSLADDVGERNVVSLVPPGASEFALGHAVTERLKSDG